MSHMVVSGCVSRCVATRFAVNPGHVTKNTVVDDFDPCAGHWIPHGLGQILYDILFVGYLVYIAGLQG